MMLSSAVSTCFPSFHSFFLPKAIGTGRKRQYFFSRPLTRLSSRNSLLSSSIYIIISVPRSAFSHSSMVNSGLPSQTHFTAFAPSLHDLVMTSTFFDTMKAE